MMRGFSLVQFIVYLALFLLLVLLVSSYIATTYRQTVDYNHHLQQQLNLYTAQDLITQDIAQASCHRNLWHLYDNGFVFHLEGTQEEVGWFIVKDRLIRITGTYNPSNTTWQNKTTSLVAPNVKAVHCILNESLESHFVTFVVGELIDCSDKTQTFITLIHNKIL